VKTGYYELSPKGRQDMVEWSEALEILEPRSEARPEREMRPV
jgi:DNA-binding PadR family transcriptional regulator